MWMFSTIYEILSFGTMMILLYVVYPSPEAVTGASTFITLGIHVVLMAMNVYLTTVMGAFANEHSKQADGSN